MPYGGSRSRSEWVTPEISGGKTKVFLVESWYNSTLALPYRLSHATMVKFQTKFYIFGQFPGKFRLLAGCVQSVLRTTD